MRLIWTALATLILSTAAFAQIDDTPDGKGEFAPAKKGIRPVIPLDVSDPTFDLWKLVRDDLSEGRDPGPIDVQRFYGGLGFTGIPTFFRLPVALVPADLSAGQVDVAIMGAYTDMGMGSRGASRGPAAFREARGEYVGWGAYSMPRAASTSSGPTSGRSRRCSRSPPTRRRPGTPSCCSAASSSRRGWATGHARSSARSRVPRRARRSTSRCSTTWPRRTSTEATARLRSPASSG